MGRVRLNDAPGWPISMPCVATPGTVVSLIPTTSRPPEVRRSAVCWPSGRTNKDCFSLGAREARLNTVATHVRNILTDAMRPIVRKAATYANFARNFNCTPMVPAASLTGDDHGHYS